MIIILKKDPEMKQLENLKAWLTSQHLTIHESRGESQTILGLVGDTTAVDIDLLRALDIVEDVKRVQPPATVRIDAPEDVVAFSWGDPSIPSAQERVIGSWSKR